MSLSTIYSETEFVSLLRQEEEDAYSYLYDHYSAALFGIILRIIPVQQEAEDALQEVFIKIYHHIGNYDAAKGRLYTWMLHIARNTAIDTLRSKEFQKAKKIHALDESVNNEMNDLSSVSNMDHVGLDKVLSALNEDQKQVIIMAYFEGYTQEEISKELGIPLGTVKTRTRNALIQLRKLLKIT
ncbi:MAG: sigma-70 family RNA polymerase sigma factor [Chitinophagaceae bacterium]|nr:MAG: sigma-70 family RNA polymerase sigma factor [Chitinophagaceae bacterium]